MQEITIYKGDDSNALGEQIVIKLDTEVDLMGCRAVFQLGDYRQEISDISGKEVEVIIPASASKKFKPGVMLGGLKVYDCEGLGKTVAGDLRFRIIESVVK
jgi:hypothetical protein